MKNLDYSKVTLKMSDKYEDDTYYRYTVDIYVGEVLVGGMTCVSNTKDFDECDGKDYVERIDIDEEHRNHGCGSTALTILADEVWGFDIAPDSEDSARLYARLGEESCTEQSAYIDQGFGVYHIGCGNH